VLRGSVTLNGQQLQAGDGAAISEEFHLDIMAKESAEIMLFDMH